MKENLKANKQIIVVSAVIVFAIISGVVVLGFLNTSMKSQKTKMQSPKDSMSKAISDPTRLVDGYDWRKIDSFGISETRKPELKGQLVQISIETVSMSGSDFLTPRYPLEDYMNYIDDFYQDDSNLNVPLLFALKIADMAKEGAPEIGIEAYRRSLIARLKKSGLVQ